MSNSAWETVIGLEIHAQLATQSKIFSGASIAFGAEANTQACAVDLALPGTLPVFNQGALVAAIKFGLATGAEIGKKSVFERKNYFYPDLPKGYQTSQLEHPIVGVGSIDVVQEDGSVKVVGLTRAHLEEDAGKSLHENFVGQSGIDLNRAGTPLLEIVSDPDIRSAKEAVAYAKQIHALVRYINICDGNMQEGSFRVDANVSIRPRGTETLGTRTEIKNLNSFRFLERAINIEVERQSDLLEDGGKVTQETRLYDADADETRSMRSKEEANDYRYFPCPDLLPIIIDDAFIDDVRGKMPELPRERLARFTGELGIGESEARQLISDRATADYFEVVASTSGQVKHAANWVINELGARLQKAELSVEESPVSAEQLGGLLARLGDDTISGKIAKQVLDALWNGEGKTADEVIEAQGLKQITDTGAIEAIVDEVLAASPSQVEEYLGGKDKMMGFFVGQIMKASKGKANPGEVNKLLKAKLKR